MLSHERHYWQNGAHRIAGVDEAGRGPLAGPVVAAAAVLQRPFAETEEHRQLGALTDSKKLSQSKREFFCRLLRQSLYVETAVGIADPDEIDALNILNSTHLAMRRALEGLTPRPDMALIDGLPVSGLPVPSVSIVRGDSESLSIAAASVIAKVFRDEAMRKLDRLYRPYGFARHKGYGTRAHIRALLEHGPCPIHRMTFRPVREASELRRRCHALG